MLAIIFLLRSAAMILLSSGNFIGAWNPIYELWVVVWRQDEPSQDAKMSRHVHYTIHEQDPGRSL